MNSSLSRATAMHSVALEHILRSVLF